MPRPSPFFFIGVARKVKPQKALDIIKGGKTEATKYLKHKCSAQLRAILEPMIAEALNEVQAVSQFNKLVKKYNSIPLIEKKEVSIERHVTDRALEAFFGALAEEEIKIRKDPEKFGSSAVKNVFKLIH